MNKPAYKRLMRHYANVQAQHKPAILNELKHGAKHDFYVDCLKTNRAFDVVVDGTKYEIGPCRYHYLCGGAEAMFRGAESDYCYPQFNENEILEIIKA